MGPKRARVRSDGSVIYEELTFRRWGVLLQFTSGVAYDLDDGQRLAAGHPGAAVILAAIAAGQQVSATLAQMILAIVCGYEAGVTLAVRRVPETVDISDVSPAPSRERQKRTSRPNFSTSCRVIDT
jgi:2-methylcitrate dehydratase PrpD